MSQSNIVSLASRSLSAILRKQSLMELSRHMNFATKGQTECEVWELIGNSRVIVNRIYSIEISLTA